MLKEKIDNLKEYMEQQKDNLVERQPSQMDLIFISTIEVLWTEVGNLKLEIKELKQELEL